jgi:hypothetical protein
LLRQLTLRFGPLPAAVAGGVREARTEADELWAERVLDAGAVHQACA